MHGCELHYASAELKSVLKDEEQAASELWAAQSYRMCQQLIKMMIIVCDNVVVSFVMSLVTYMCQCLSDTPLDPVHVHFARRPCLNRLKTRAVRTHSHAWQRSTINSTI